MSSTLKTAALRIPILPHTSPEAEQHSGLQLPLRSHQLRALSRCLVIEDPTSKLNEDFGHMYDFKSRGGCLADQVGTGKTATTIGLILNDDVTEGDTLVVAPKHLIPQWKQEILKFASLDAVEVIVGKKEYEKQCGVPAYNKRRVVLIDVDTILQEDKLWYYFPRKVSRTPGGAEVKIDETTRQKYRTAAQFSVRSPKGPCTYEGWLYTGSLHLTQSPWRRVVFDEIQDLVQDGTESQKNLLQLTRTAQNVWLLSATPFPHGNQSVYANHELLGFCRLKMDVEVDSPLPSYHPFERIKRQLYIRSPPHVADEAVNATVTRHTEYVPQLNIEERFYHLEFRKIQNDNPSLSEADHFAPEFHSLREMTVHPEASEEMRKIMTMDNRREYTRGVSTSVQGAAQRAVRDAKKTLAELNETPIQQQQKQIQNTQRSLHLATKVKAHRETTPLLANVFQGVVDPAKVKARKEKEYKLIHDEYCCCGKYQGAECYADRHVKFRIIREPGSFGPEFLKSAKDVMQYFEEELAEDKQVWCGRGQVPAINNYATVTKRTLDMRVKAMEAQQTQCQELKTRIQTLSAVAGARSSTSSMEQEDYLSTSHGSKPAALVKHLEKLVENGEQVIVFSYWHDTLKLIKRTLHKCKLSCVFCDGHQTSKALLEFTRGDANIILLSAQSKASGANLQCATHVVLLDPAGESGEHGSTLEEQAIGRAVRMGQDKPVTVTRFCVVGTLEEAMFQDIDQAQTTKHKRASDSSYIIKDSHKVTTKEKPKPKPKNFEVEVTAALTQEQRLQREFEKAVDNGEVIDILDDSDDEEDPMKTPAKKTSKHPHVSIKPISVKQESETRKRKEEETAEPQTIEPTPKRICTNEINTDGPSSLKTPAPETQRATVTPLTREVSMEEDNALSSSKTTFGAEVEKRSLWGTLERFGVVEYFSKFVRAGVDSIDKLYEIADREVEMESLVDKIGFKPSHAIRFQSNLVKEVKASSSSSNRSGEQNGSDRKMNEEDVQEKGSAVIGEQSGSDRKINVSNGTTFKKNFGKHGVFVGEVIGFEHPFYQVKYSDGDVEDLSPRQLLNLLQADANCTSRRTTLRKRI